MNNEAWDVLIQRLQQRGGMPVSEQLRVLAAVVEQSAIEVRDVLYIAADAHEDIEEES
jgi:hypothetical protein